MPESVFPSNLPALVGALSILVMSGVSFQGVNGIPRTGFLGYLANPLIFALGGLLGVMLPLNLAMDFEPASFDPIHFAYLLFGLGMVFAGFTSALFLYTKLFRPNFVVDYLPAQVWRAEQRLGLLAFVFYVLLLALGFSSSFLPDWSEWLELALVSVGTGGYILLPNFWIRKTISTWQPEPEAPVTSWNADQRKTFNSVIILATSLGVLSLIPFISSLVDGSH